MQFLSDNVVELDGGFASQILAQDTSSFWLDDESVQVGVVSWRARTFRRIFIYCFAVPLFGGGSSDCKSHACSLQQLEENCQLKETRKKGPNKRREVLFPDIISGMKTWLSLERACGHTICKQDLLAEYLGRLQLTANEFRNKASAADITALQKNDLLKEISDREARKSTIMATQVCRKSTAGRLVNWLDAKYRETELVTNMSEAEAPTRTKLTWQEFDHSLWLATHATQQALA